MDIDPYEYIAAELTDDTDQLLTGLPLARAGRAWDTYARCFGVRPTPRSLLDFDLAFFDVVDTHAELLTLWVQRGGQQDHDLEGGPSMEDGLLVLLTVDGFATFERRWLPNTHAGTDRP